MKLIQEEQTLATAAAKAGMDEKTARKYRDRGKLPSQIRPERTWRTRKDAFEEVWPGVLEILERDAAIEAKTVFDYLCRQHPGRFQEGEVRSLQRRIKAWRARCGPSQEVMFVQHHRPGRQAQSDFTYMNGLGVMIAGQLFDHLVYHFTLTYSNWESVTVCFSESFESLSAGLQNALWEVGAVPENHRSDSLSAAVKNMKDEDEFTERYQGLMRHYGMRPSHNTPGRGHENGDVEQAHHRFKKAVEQEMILRGSREFPSRIEYVAFLGEILNRRNGRRQEKLQHELNVMHRLPAKRTDDWSRWSGKVSAFSTVNVKHNIYSVDSRLIGEQIDVRAYAEELEVWYGGQKIEQMARLRGRTQYQVDYRHIIDWLVRKPGAFANYRYREHLFPSSRFRMAYDLFREITPRRCDRRYLEILELAAKEGEARVDDALRLLLATASGRKTLINQEAFAEFLERCDQVPDLTDVHIAEVPLESFDQLFSEAGG